MNKRNVSYELLKSGKNEEEIIGETISYYTDEIGKAIMPIYGSDVAFVIAALEIMAEGMRKADPEAGEIASLAKSIVKTKVAEIAGKADEPFLEEMYHKFYGEKK